MFDSRRSRVDPTEAEQSDSWEHPAGKQYGWKHHFGNVPPYPMSDVPPKTNAERNKLFC